MNKLMLMSGLLALSLPSFAQSPLWWKLDGSNNGTALTAIGLSNSVSLRFKTSGTEWMSISPTGEYYFNTMSGATKGMFGVSTDGKVYRIDFTGNSNDVFRGDGSFAPLSSLSGWNFNGSYIYTTHNVGIGTNIAPEKLTVDGNIVANGSISGTSLNVIDIVTSGREFKVSTSLCMKGIDVNDPNSRNEICGMNGDLYLQSGNGNYNTIINKGNGGKVGIGILPAEDFHVGVKTRFNNDVFTDKIYTNRITSEDTAIYIGDSSIIFDHPKNKISWSNTSVPSKLNPNVYLPVYGLTIGRGNSLATGNNSIAIGTNVSVSGGNSVVIGNGVSSNTFLSNANSNSLMVGFNSNIPTFYVSPASGVNTIGTVGIGTTCVPSGYTLAVDGKIIAEEVTVEISDAQGCWPDYVFNVDYIKMNYLDKKQYLQRNKHLPHLPSALDISNDGLSISEIMIGLTRNVEENSLEIIDVFEAQNETSEEVNNLKAELQKNEKLLEEQRLRIESLEAKVELLLKK
jgi:hypothetical protein